jgi:hypothetical protein
MVLGVIQKCLMNFLDIVVCKCSFDSFRSKAGKKSKQVSIAFDWRCTVFERKCGAEPESQHAWLTRCGVHMICICRSMMAERRFRE